MKNRIWIIVKLKINKIKRISNSRQQVTKSNGFFLNTVFLSLKLIYSEKIEKLITKLKASNLSANKYRIKRC